MKTKGIIVVFIILLAIWLILNQTLKLPILLLGIGLALFLAITMCRHCNIINEIKLTPKAFIYTIAYLFAFTGELIKANFDIAWRVLSPSLPINPGIVKAETKLNSKMARLILANSITLTPGTFTIDIVGNSLYIHCVHLDEEDPEKYAQSIVHKFEKYLEVLYG